MVQAHTGLSQIPRPRSGQELTARLEQHYPAELRRQGRTGSVLLDVSVDEHGVVRDVAVATRPPASARQQIRAVAVATDPRTGRTVEHELPNDYDNAFGPAAQQALRGVRFTPAVRDGRAVAHTLRMTVRFGPPPSH